MDGKSYTGIYISQTSATVVALNFHGKEQQVLDCFSVSVEQAETEDSEKLAQELAELVAKNSAQRSLSFQDRETFIALDCSMFLQHDVRSEFTDPRQIANSIYSDTEEVFATDISDLVLAFKIVSKDSSGSNVTVYTAKRKTINDLLTAFQKQNINPVTIEPDIVCLPKLLSAQFRPQKDVANIFAFLSVENGYIIASEPNSNKPPVSRTFFISPSQNRTALLKSQLMLTQAMIDSTASGTVLRILDSADSVDAQQLSRVIPTETVDLNTLLDSDKIPLADCKDKVHFAIACGAALSFTDKTQSVDFRRDFSPYQGQKEKFHKTLKIACLCAVICLFCLGIFFQQKLYSVNKPRKLFYAQFEADFLSVIPGTKEMPKPFSEAVRKLEREKNRLLSIHQGRFDESGAQSVPAKFTQLLKAFNACAKETGIAIDSISITGKTITLSASTTSKQNMLKLRESILNNNMLIKQENDLGFKDGRNLFKLTLETK